jgi:hypothetical protein
VSRVRALVAAAAVLTLWPTPAAADGRRPTGDERTIATRAVAAVDRDGRIAADAALDLRWSLGPVTAANLAVAYAHCTNCRAIAVSFQVVLAARTGGKVTATNRAFATNDRCSRCESLAVAIQYVLVTDQPVRLLPSGQVRLHRLRHRLAEVLRSGEPADQLQRQVTEIGAEVEQVLATALSDRAAIRVRRADLLRR